MILNVGKTTYLSNVPGEKKTQEKYWNSKTENVGSSWLCIQLWAITHMSSHTDCSGSIWGSWSLCLGAEPANSFGNIGTSLGRQAVAEKGCSASVGGCVGQHGCSLTVSLPDGTNMHKVWGQLLLYYPEASVLYCLSGPVATEAVSKGLREGYLDHE